LGALRDAGATVTVAAPETGVVRTLEHDRDPGPEVPVDAAHDTVRAADFDALVLPGGTLNADSLRGDETAQFIARAFAADGGPVGKTYTHTRTHHPHLPGHRGRSLCRPGGSLRRLARLPPHQLPHPRRSRRLRRRDHRRPHLRPEEEP